METPQTEAAVPQNQEQKKKRSPWLVVLIILLIIMMCCCITGALLCRGGAMLPDFLERYLRDVPGMENADEIWGLFEDIINDPDFDLDDFNPQDYFPEGDGPDMEEFLPQGSSDGSICEGLSGNFEMQVLVGPSDAVGLEPFGVGFIPFTVVYDQGMYIVEGYGTIDYEDILEFQGGTFTVFFDMVGEIDGVCTETDDDGVLDFTFNMVGDQVFIVDSANGVTEYPKHFEYDFQYSFPVVDGATESGLEWALILHLD